MSTRTSTTSYRRYILCGAMCRPHAHIQVQFILNNPEVVLGIESERQNTAWGGIPTPVLFWSHTPTPRALNARAVPSTVSRLRSLPLLLCCPSHRSGLNSQGEQKKRPPPPPRPPHPPRPTSTWWIEHDLEGSKMDPQPPSTHSQYQEINKWSISLIFWGGNPQHSQQK